MNFIHNFVKSCTHKYIFERTFANTVTTIIAILDVIYTDSLIREITEQYDVFTREKLPEFAFLIISFANFKGDA